MCANPACPLIPALFHCAARAKKMKFYKVAVFLQSLARTAKVTAKFSCLGICTKTPFFFKNVFFWGGLQKGKNDKSICPGAASRRAPPGAQFYAYHFLFFEKRKNQKTSYHSGFCHFGGSQKSLFGPPSAVLHKIGLNAYGS